MELSPAFRKTVLSVYEGGSAWLDNFPELIGYCIDRWGLSGLRAFEPLSYNFVAEARRADGTAAVLKLSPGLSWLESECAALTAWNGEGAVRVLDAAPDRGIMLLERVFPGEQMAALALRDDDAATRQAAQCMRRIWREPDDVTPFETLGDLTDAFARYRRANRGVGPLPPGLVDEGEHVFWDLVDSTTNPMLLHGDIHHFNLLSSDREPWLLIDAQGFIGDPGFEVGPFLANPKLSIASDADLATLLERRLDILAEELAFDRARLRAWGFAYAALSACWSVEDGTGYEYELRIASVLRP